MSLAAWTWSCLRPYRGRVAILTTIAATNVALGVLAPWPLKLVVDNVLEGRPLPGALDRIGVALAGDNRAALLVLVVCGGLLLQVLTQTLSMINVQVQVDTGQRLVYALRGQLLAHLQALALRHHVVTRTADSVYRLEADAYCVHDLVMSGLLKGWPAKVIASHRSASVNTVRSQIVAILEKTGFKTQKELMACFSNSVSQDPVSSGFSSSLMRVPQPEAIAPKHPRG